MSAVRTLSPGAGASHGSRTEPDFASMVEALHDQIKRVMVSFDADQLLDEERGGPKFFEPVPGPLSNLVVAITSTTS